MSDQDLASCSACLAPIRWVLTEGDKRMPIDPTPSPDGNVVPVRRDDGSIRARVLTGDQLPAQRTAWVPHHRTCPHADDFRRRKRAAAVRCGVCREPMDPVLAAHGHTTHPGCAPVPGRMPRPDEGGPEQEALTL
jgi:hypothetical protein